MTDRIDELLTRLKQLGSLAADNIVSKQTLVTYEEILNALAQVKDPRIIQPLIESVGYGTGYGLYWTVVHMLERFAPERNFNRRNLGRHRHFT